ncbi:30S ribosome-binding factor [Buchnera aphidicola (Tetraneura ulmi)]|uniref:30S ribosome-binding factor RbfA n=1 Tax=Buchnera aphidicola TaxID=9 RepID=UPI0034648EDE
MKKKPYRNFQLSEEMRKEISKILQIYCNDSRINKLNVSIVEVLINKDFSIAKVFFTIFNVSNKEEVIKILQNSSSYIKKKLGKNLLFRIVPKIKFIYDSSFIEGIRISKIINKVIKKNK